MATKQASRQSSCSKQTQEGLFAQRTAAQRAVQIGPAIEARRQPLDGVDRDEMRDATAPQRGRQRPVEDGARHRGAGIHDARRTSAQDDGIEIVRGGRGIGQGRADRPWLAEPVAITRVLRARDERELGGRRVDGATDSRAGGPDRRLPVAQPDQRQRELVDAVGADQTSDLGVGEARPQARAGIRPNPPAQGSARASCRHPSTRDGVRAPRISSRSATGPR